VFFLFAFRVFTGCNLNTARVLDVVESFGVLPDPQEATKTDIYDP
jgi:hypothetical protein